MKTLVWRLTKPRLLMSLPKQQHPLRPFGAVFLSPAR